MSAFYTGGFPATVPEGERECRYTPRGRVARALRDVPALARHEVWGDLLAVVVVAVTTGAFFVTSENDGQLERVLSVLEGLGVGIVSAGVLLFLWGLRPTEWRRHWREENSERDRPDGDWHSFLSLHSRHWHTVINPTCVVTGPDGRKWRKTWKPLDRTQMLLGPGTRMGPLVYPNDFGAPWPEPGKYKIEWFSRVEHGTEPMRLARMTWKVRELPWDQSAEDSESSRGSQTPSGG